MRTNDIFFVKPLISVFIHLFSINISWSTYHATGAVDEALRKTDKDHCPWSFHPTREKGKKCVHRVSDGGAGMGLLFNWTVQEGGLSGRVILE